MSTDINKRDVWLQQIDNIFKTETKEDYEIFLDIISLALATKTNSDLSKAYKAIGIEKLGELINAFSGKTITFPDKLEFRDVLVVSACYYLKEVQGLSWDEIKAQLPYQDISSIKYGKMIIKLSDTIKSQIATLMKSNEGYRYEE